nr:MAG TPA: hypothetical protein [Caudoviricetes sp.]
MLVTITFSGIFTFLYLAYFLAFLELTSLCCFLYRNKKHRK